MRDSRGTHEFGEATPGLEDAFIEVHNDDFYRFAALSGALGAAESYIRKQWDSPDLVSVIRVLARNLDVTRKMNRTLAAVLAPARRAANWFNRNTKRGSRQNISAHYDLSNDLFQLMLDPTMTYSSGFYESPEDSLENASIEKYDRICRKMNLSPSDRVLEIGTGWGGFAEHAVKNYGCQVTTTTISTEQHDYAAQRFSQAGLNDRVHLLKKDYRDLDGTYDKIVSIEMIEAVGQKFLPGYFTKCHQLLKERGQLCLQAITIPEQRYTQYAKSVDFIQRYIFPGGFLPSLAAILRITGQHTDLQLQHQEDFGQHYAWTLDAWRQNFWNNIAAVRRLGFDDRFVRTWHYYLCYCEAGFLEQKIGVSQLLFTKS